MLALKDPYIMGIPQLRELQILLEELLKKCHIRPISSPWGHLTLCVRNKDNISILCVDYRKMNETTIKNKYLLPRTDDIFNQLREENMFSSIDLIPLYH